jgi:hypothetical protein
MKHKRFRRWRDISLSQGRLAVVHAALDSSEGRGAFHSIVGGLDRTERTCSTASTTIQYVTLLSGERAQRRTTGARIIPSLGSIFSAQKVRACVIKPHVIVPAQGVLQKVSQLRTAEGPVSWDSLLLTDRPMIHRSMASNVNSPSSRRQLGGSATRLFLSTGFHRRSCREFSNTAPRSTIWLQPHKSVSIGVLPSYQVHLSGPASSFGPAMISTVHSHTSSGLSQRLSTSV